MIFMNNKSHTSSLDLIPWGVKDIFVVLFYILFFLILIFTFSSKIREDENLSSFIVYSSLLIFPIFYVQSFQKGTIQDLGINRKIDFKKSMLLGLLGLLILLLIASGLDIRGFIKFLKGLKFSVIIVLASLISIFNFHNFVYIIPGPFCEEVFFRGFIYAGLRKKIGIMPAILVSSFIFSLFHLDFDVASSQLLSILQKFLNGLVLVFLYERYQTIFPCFFAHMGSNLIATYLSRFWFLSNAG